jgi:cohesin complex subunit SCC1
MAAFFLNLYCLVCCVLEFLRWISYFVLNMDAHQTQICPISGMCSNLHAAYDRSFPCVSDPDAECASHEPEAGDGNDGGQDAPPERQSLPSPTCPENKDAPSEQQLSPKSPGVVGAQPESLPTPTSPETGAARDDYMLPELPRFSPAGMPSPAREDDSPFKTCSQTPLSRLGGTGYTDRTPDSKYSLPGQSTAHTMASLFPINEDDLPEIHGLISTPGGVSSVGTSVTGLGSMSARTR